MIEPCGVLLLDKSEGMTSHDCVNKIRRLYNTKKVGHTGTLDPMATGLLPILIGRAAKASDYLTAETKRYLGTLQLGIVTDTQDTTGEILNSFQGNLPTLEEVTEKAKVFEGEILQIPPMYSALKVNGQKLVDLARKGIEIDRVARPITVHQLTVTKGAQEGQYLLDVICSKGTYIRTLCHDLGQALGCGGAMASLRRLETGGFSLANAVTLEQLENMTQEEKENLLLPIEQLFADVRKMQLPSFFDRLAKNGCPIFLSKLKGTGDFQLQERISLWDNEGFWGLGEVQMCKIQEESEEAAPAIRVIKRFRL